MTTINKTLLVSLRADIEAALAKIAKKHKLDGLNLGAFKFDDSTCRATLEGKTAAGKKAADDGLVAMLMDLGFTKAGATKPFVFGSKKFVITGLRRTRFTLQCQETNRSYSAKVEQVMNAIRAKHPAFLSKSAR
ncbi:hypothetical protein D3C87_1476330 [compost metagenome]